MGDLRNFFFKLILQHATYCKSQIKNVLFFKLPKAVGKQGSETSSSYLDQCCIEPSSQIRISGFFGGFGWVCSSILVDKPVFGRVWFFWIRAAGFDFGFQVSSKFNLSSSKQFEFRYIWVGSNTILEHRIQYKTLKKLFHKIYQCTNALFAYIKSNL